MRQGERAPTRNSRGRRLGVQLRLDRFIQTLAAVAFGLGFLTFGIVGFARIAASERRSQAKLYRIETGEIQADTLTVQKKYVNPGRSGLPHIVFSSARLRNVDVSATKDFFNSVNPGDAIRGYYFPDGYFIPENQRADTGAGKWFFLGVGVLLGASALALARATTQLP